MKDERFKNAGETVWVWDVNKENAEQLTLIMENKDGSCFCVLDQKEAVFFYKNYSFNNPNKKEYEPYGAGEMPQLDWVVRKENNIKYLVTAYDPNGDCQLFLCDTWFANKDVFALFTDTNGNLIGKEKR